jgi:hypothetical protein
MRIETLRANAAAQAKRPGARTSASGFSGMVSMDDDVALRPASGLVATASVANLVDLQIADDQRERGSRERQKLLNAHDSLDMLAELQRSLAMGQASVTQLKNLSARAAAHRHDSNDPQLDEILAEINLRLAVETAKLEMARGGS